jgi:hypothetical protein
LDQPSHYAACPALPFLETKRPRSIVFLSFQGDMVFFSSKELSTLG